MRSNLATQNFFRFQLFCLLGFLVSECGLGNPVYCKGVKPGEHTVRGWIAGSIGHTPKPIRVTLLLSILRCDISYFGEEVLKVQLKSYKWCQRVTVGPRTDDVGLRCNQDQPNTITAYHRGNGWTDESPSGNESPQQSFRFSFQSDGSIQMHAVLVEKSGESKYAHFSTYDHFSTPVAPDPSQLVRIVSDNTSESEFRLLPDVLEVAVDKLFANPRETSGKKRYAHVVFSNETRFQVSSRSVYAPTFASRPYDPGMLLYPKDDIPYYQTHIVSLMGNTIEIYVGGQTLTLQVRVKGQTTTPPTSPEDVSIVDLPNLSGITTIPRSPLLLSQGDMKAIHFTNNSSFRVRIRGRSIATATLSPDDGRPDSALVRLAVPSTLFFDIAGFSPQAFEVRTRD